MSTTMKSLDERIDTLVDKLDATTLSAASFKAKAESTFSFAKWVGVFVSGVAVTGLLQLYSVANQAGQLQNGVAEMRETSRKQDAAIEQQRASIQKQEVATTELRGLIQELREAVRRQDEVVKELREAIRHQDEVVKELREAVRRQDAASSKQTQLLETIAKDLGELKRKSNP